MYIRSKMVKGHTYYFVVQGRREGGKVRQRTIVSLGRHCTLTEALAASQDALGRLRRARKRMAVPNPPKALAGRLAALDRRIVTLAERVEIMKVLREQGIC
jgi:hypothetical protein